MNPIRAVPNLKDVALADARFLWSKAWNITHLPDEVWNLARQDALSAARLILEREKLSK